jgi:hypothetical protein
LHVERELTKSHEDGTWCAHPGGPAGKGMLAHG